MPTFSLPNPDGLVAEALLVALLGVPAVVRAINGNITSRTRGNARTRTIECCSYSNAAIRQVKDLNRIRSRSDLNSCRCPARHSGIPSIREGSFSRTEAPRTNMHSAPSRLPYLMAILFVLSLLLGSCSLVGMGSATPAERAQYLEPMLSAAGFHMVAADSSEKMQHLKKLPALKVNYYVGNNGELHYWFADPDYCHCLYQGNEQAYQQYEKLRIQARMAKRQQEAAEENYEASQDMQMNMMDPFFGGFGPGLGFAF